MQTHNKNILMCSADWFEVKYEINAWMHEGQPVNRMLAQKQWQNVYNIYTKQLGWDVQLIKPVQHLPDMVFATDCCLMIDGKILLSNFRCPERQPESLEYEHWFRENGYVNIKQTKSYFEGGDNLLCGNKILAGYGFRSSLAAAQEIQNYFDCEVVSLRITNPNFYHLDTSVAVLSDDTVAFYSAAIDKVRQRRLRAAIPNVIEVTLDEASGFGLNAVSDGRTVVTSDGSESLLAKYRAGGFQAIGTDVSEFRKSGGGVKCMTLRLLPK
jgi:N-dimethylarginine dimethylaminohydrolase